MEILLLRQIERGLLAIFSGMLMKNMAKVETEKSKKYIYLAILFFCGFLTEGILNGVINTAYIHILIIAEIIFVVNFASNGKNLSTILPNAVVAYAILVMLFLASSVLPVAIGILVMGGQNDVFVKTLSIPIFIILALLICSRAERANIGLAFKNKYLRCIAAIISFTVLSCECIAAIFYGKRSYFTVSSFLCVISFSLICILVFLIVYSNKEYKKYSEIQTEINKKNEEIKKLKLECDECVKEIHRIKKAAMVTAEMLKRIKKTNNETSEEFIRQADDFIQMYEEYSDDEKKQASEIAVQFSTGFTQIDDFLCDCACRAARKDILFSAINAYPANELIDGKIISSLLLHRMMADLINNAFHAVELSEGAKRIMIITGVTSMHKYNISVFDSGAPFDKKILEHLGERGNTTDGTGHGLADVFETLAKCNASFIIENLDREESGYTKVVQVVFDGKNEKKII